MRSLPATTTQGKLDLTTLTVLWQDELSGHGKISFGHVLLPICY